MTNFRAASNCSAPETASLDVLRQEMVDKIIEWRAQLNAELSSEVEAALRRVPRHLFVPGVSLKEAYANEAVITKRDKEGVALSSVSAPGIIAAMLQQLEVKPGHRVLEIGSGGYNAALLKDLVDPSGEVTTMDIDPDVIDRARKGLAETGCDVNVVCGDGEFGSEDHAPYDRIVVTVGAWDIPPAWRDQLAKGGRLVVPLRTRGLTRSVVFERDSDHLASRSYELCGFVPMQGVGENRERLVLLHERQVGLRVDDGLQVEADRLREALSQPRVEEWSNVTVGGMEPFDDLDLWLATSFTNFCLLTAEQEAIDSGLVQPQWRMGTPTLVDGGSFAYRSLRPVDDERTRFEFGVYAHGPDAGKVALRMVEQIRIWDREQRSGPGPRFTAHPAGTPDEQLPNGLVLDKRHTRVTITWPPARTT